MPLSSTNSVVAVVNARTNEQTEESRMATTSPIDLLPNELIAVIISEATHAQPTLKKAYAYPSTLCLVSKLWHEVTKQTHAVWNTVIIESSRTLSQVPERIRRSGNLLLDIRIDESVAGYRNVVEAMDYLLPVSDRWQTLGIVVEDNIQQYMIHIPSSLLQLLNLLVQCEHDNDTIEVPPLLLFSPHLQTVSIANVPIFWDPSTTIFANLTNFTFSGFNNSLQFDILLDHIQNSPHLVSLSLTQLVTEEVTSEEFDSTMKRTIPLLELTKLTLRGLYPYEVCLFTSALKTPNLKDLTLSIVELGHVDPPVTYDYTRIKLECPALEKLSLDHMCMSVDEAVHVLQPVPPLLSLQSDLELSHYTDDDLDLDPTYPIFRALFDNPVLCHITSKLSTLTSRGIPIPQLYDTMLKFLQRVQHPPVLFVFHQDIDKAHWQGESSKQALATLSELVRLEEWYPNYEN